MQHRVGEGLVVVAVGRGHAVTATAIGACDAPVDWCWQVLDSRGRRQAGITAAASGLYLVAVEYPKKFNLPVLAKGPYII